LKCDHSVGFMDLVRGRVAEVLEGTMGGAFVEVGDRILENAATGGINVERLTLNFER